MLHSGRRIFILLIGISICIISGCQSVPRSETAAIPPETFELKPASLRIATFNIANLGGPKLSKPDVVSALVTIVRKYDIIAVQEIDDRSLKAPEAFLDAINRTTGDIYGVIYSEETGLDASSGEKEQYAFYYNRSRIEPVGGGKLFPDQATRLFVREPFAAQFQLKEGGPSFVMLNIHTAPRVAALEIASLRQAIDWAVEAFDGEEGVVLLGDFNAGVAYVSKAKIRSIRDQNLPFVWVVPDDADTTLATGRDQAHDRIVLTDEFSSRYTSTWGVDRGVTSTMSDHYLVWAEFDMSARQ